MNRSHMLGLVGGFALLGTSVASAELIYGLSNRNHLIRFDSATPGVVTNLGVVSGLLPGERLEGIDFRPANGLLYAVGSSSRLYTLNTDTAAATTVGSGFSTPNNGNDYGFDFNPTVDRIRIVSDQDMNRRLNPNDGNLAAIDQTLGYSASDPNFGRNPRVVASAYTNNRAGATTTTLYNIDADLNALVTQTPPNEGVLNTVGLLGVDTTELTGFDISSTSGSAFASLTLSPGSLQSRLYQLNLATGAATEIGAIGFNTPLSSISIVIPEPASLTLLALAGLAGLRRR